MAVICGGFSVIWSSAFSVAWRGIWQFALNQNKNGIFRAHRQFAQLMFRYFEIPASRGSRTACSPLQRLHLQQSLMLVPRCGFQERVITGL